MSRKRKDFEIRFYESIVSVRPNFINALASLGDVYTKKGFYEEGLVVDKRLVQLMPQDPVVHYNLACSFSVLGEIKEAFKMIKRAVLLGYDDFTYMMKDRDLDNLRKTPEFKDFRLKLAKLKK